MAKPNCAFSSFDRNAITIKLFDKKLKFMKKQNLDISMNNLKIPNWQSEEVNRRRPDSTIAIVA